jgi:hypothetical protein
MRRVIETEVYRGPAQVVALPFVAVGVGVALLAFAVSRDPASWVVGVFVLLLAYNIYFLLWQAYEASVAPDGIVTFHSPIRRRVVRVQDVRRIRHMTGQGGGGWLKFTFSGGSVRMLKCRRIEDLESRLRKLNPSIR